jgi:putative ABC transport system permease protein
MISLAGFEAMHIGWEFGTPPKSPTQGLGVLHDRQTEGRRLDPKQLQPTQVTAVLVGLESRAQVFSARRAIEAMKGGSLMAVLPGVALDELWQILSTVESTLSLMAWVVALSALLGVSATLLIALDARRRELAILRAVGASARTILCFILLESLLVCVAGIVVGWLSVQLGLLGFSGVLQQEFGIVLQHRLPDAEAWIAIAGIIGFSVVASAIPAWRAFRYSVHDGLHPPSV